MVTRLRLRHLLPLPLFALVLGLAPPPAVASIAAAGIPAAGAAAPEISTQDPPATGAVGRLAQPDGAGDGLVDVYEGLSEPGAADEDPAAGSASGSRSESGVSGVSGVDDAVRDAVAADGSAEVMVRLRDQVDLAQAGAQAARVGRAAAAAAAQELDGAPAQLDDHAREVGRTARGEFVVDTLQATADRTQPEVRDLLHTHGAEEVREFWIFNGFAATVDRAALDALATHPSVASVTLDDTITLDEPDVDGPGEPQLPVWSLERINATDTWGDHGVRGDGVVVGVMDSGVDGDHPALAESWRGQSDPEASWFVPTGENYPEPGDGNGHGTHVTGSIVGAPPGEVTGVAPEAEWIAAKIFNDFGSTSDSIINAGFEWMLAPGGDPAAAPDVVNNSWGANDPLRTEFWEPVEALVAAGIVPVFSNGNAGPGTGTVGSPASFPHAIGVGATDIEDRIAYFSSRGPVTWDGAEYVKPQVSAPGHEVFSTLPGGEYGLASGTSMASPHVTGVVALMLSAAPGITVDEVRDALQDSARRESHMAALPNAYGTGVVDAHAAVTRVAHSGRVTGTVTDEAGDPMEATVSVDGRDHPAGASGEYAVWLPAGDHELTVHAYGFQPQTHEVTVAVDATVTLDVTLAAAAPQPLSGTVTAGGEPVADARVTLPDTPLPATQTDADGRFALEVPEGTYRLQVTAGGHAPTSPDVVVDGATDVDVELTAVAEPALPGWPQYQNNPAHTGRSADALAADTLQEDWTAEAGGGITFSSPVVDDGRVFVNADHGELVALDLSDGEQLWSFAGGPTMRGAPAVADGVVYTGGGEDGGIHAVDAATGEPVWTVETPQRRTIYTAPVVRDGVVYATTGFTSERSDTVLALDAVTGDELWSADIGERVFFGPAVSGDLVVAASAGSRELVALDADTGAEVWTLQRESDEFIASPAIADGTVYVTTSVPPETLAPGWQGSLLAVDAATGELRWEVPTHGDGQGTTPAVHGDLVIAGSHGQGVVAAYDRDTGDPAWHYGLPVSGGVSASVLVSGDGYVIAGSQIDQRLFALDAATGELVWQQQVDANVLSSAAYAQGRVVTAASDGTLRAFHPTGQVTGTVTGPDGAVPATVRVVEADRETEADPDTGEFEIAGLLPGEYTLEVSRYGYATDTRTVTVRVAQTSSVAVTLTPVGTGALAGTVTDEDGQPLAGATVQLSSTPLEPAVTGDDGTYAVDEVAAGTYQVSVDADGYAPAQETVTVTAGETTAADFTLPRYDVAVVADHESRVGDALTAAGWRVDSVTFDELAGTLHAYQAVVLAGTSADRADADPDRFAQIIADADQAGTSLVFLDTGGPSYGSIRTLSQVTGDPATEAAQLHNRGAIWLEDVVDHPITAGLPDQARVPLLDSGSWHDSFADYSGHTLATVGSDQEGQLGDGVGYLRRTMDNNHILLASAAPSPWADWDQTVPDLLAGAVSHAAQASYGTVEGQVTDAGGEPVAATIEVADDLARTVADDDDGGYQLLLEPGEHVLRISFLGAESVQVPVTVAAGEVRVRDAALPDAELGTVAGTVTRDGGDTPVAGATVSLVGSTLPAVTTGPDGQYVVPDAPGGSYDVEVTAEGHEPAVVEDVTVVEGEVSHVDVELARAPGVVVIGDRDDEMSTFLEDHAIPVEQAGWEVTDNLDAVQVVVLNNPSQLDRPEFLAALAAFDEAGVSVIFPADGWSFRTRGFDMLVEHTGNPSDYGQLGGFSGPEIFLHDLAEHPLFEGIDEDPAQLLTAASEAAYFPDYSGVPLADVAEAGQEPAGIGMAYDVRTPDSVHLLLSGLAATFRNSPEGNWTPGGQQIFLNAVRWAADPGQAGLSGTVTDADGDPIAGATVDVTGTDWGAVTDANGAFEIGVPPGEHTLRYRAFGYQTSEQTLTVGADETADASVQLPVADVGAVTGVVDSGDGGALEGVRVRLRGTPRETLTGADGSYSIPLVEPGSYDLELETDDHVRTLAQVEVAAGATTERDVTLRPSPLVGIIDDSDSSSSRNRGKEFLADWGYEAEDIGFDSLDSIGGYDLIVANVSDFGLELDRGGLQAFEEEVNRAGVPVLWMGQHGRGGIEFLHQHHGDPAVIGEGYHDGAVTGQVAADHPLVAGLPDEFGLMVDDGRYSYFDEFDGTTVANLATGDGGEVGATIAYRGRTTDTVDVLLSTMSISTWGAPSTRESAAQDWTPEAERVFVNALDWALDAQDIGAEVLGTVSSDTGGTIASRVEVLETGRTYTGRSGDGTFLVPLPPGTWTLQVSSFGHEDATREITVAAGDALAEQVTLLAQPAGTVAGSITGPDGQAVDGAQVQLLDTPLEASTGDGGGYQLDAVPAGDWTMQVSADGFRTVQRPVTVTDGETTDVDVQLPATSPVAVIDTTGSSSYGESLAGLLGGHGYDVTLVDRDDLGTLTVDDYHLIVFNGTLLSSHREAFGDAVAAAADAGVSTIFAGQHGASYPLNVLPEVRGDPAQADWGFVSEGIDYVPSTGHPIFAGFPAGEPIELIGNLPNQQWSSYADFSGQTIAHVHARTDGEDLGEAVGYRFSSPTSVEVLLGGMAATTYGAPDDGWTDDARRIYLNAVAWSLDATQAELSGVVTGAGDPLAGATVTAVEAGVTDVTAGDGSYSLGLAAGDYTVEVSAFGFEPAEEEVQVPESGTVTLDVDLTPLPRGSVAGTVGSAGGDPVAGATVTGDGPLEWEATSDADGGYTAGDLIEGDYQVTVTADGFLPAAGSVTVTAGQTATLDLTLQPTDVGVLGDVDGALVRHLREADVPAAALAWDADADLSPFRVLVVNGGAPDRDTFEAVLAAADEAEVSVVFTGTWATDRGGIRLLERHTDRVEVGAQGYGDGAVELTGFDPAHPLFAGLDDPARLIVEGGYYSALADYTGGYGPRQLAELRVARDDGDPVTGLAVATDWRTAGSVEVLLSASALTEAVGPGAGWTPEGSRLLVNAIGWARDAELAVPAPPTLAADAPVVAGDEVTVSGTAQWPSEVTVRRGGEPVATVEAAADGSWSAQVPLQVGANSLTAVATNLAGDSEPSAAVTVARWDASWRVHGRSPVWPVQLHLDGPPPLAEPADRATLVVRDADGTVVAEHDMRWVTVFYLQILRGLPPGGYQLSAELEVDGHVVVVDGPALD